jgi:4-diphosphocytidyl-2-C-methyl-D-erythritol kinase
MILFPPAKINLGLHILFKRNDGYHELETVMTPLPFTDILEILPCKKFEFIQTGLTIPGDSQSNLCVKAYLLMREKYNIPPVYIHLRKIIPMGGGLGGGSSDAAFVLKGINDLFQLNLTTQKLEELAAQLGSDCPFFIQNIPQVAKGRGEILTPIELKLKGYYIKILNLGIHVGTKEAYDGCTFSNNSKTLSDIISQPISTWKNELKNDFENSVFKIHPKLEAAKQALYNDGAIYAAMTGSGSTLFGIFEIKPELTQAASREKMELIVAF